MVGEAVDRDREGWIRKVLDYVAVLHKILALSSGIQPERGDVVDVVKTYKRIIEGFSDFVTIRGHILEPPAENAGIDPAGIVQDEESRQVAIRGKVNGIARFEVEGMEPKHAAVIHVPVEQESAREEESRDVLGGDVTGDFSLAND